MPCGDFSLENAIVLVTGAGSGINLAFAELCAAQKCRGIIIADLRLTDEARRFIDSDASKTVFVKCDVTKRADLENLVKVSLEHWHDVPDFWVAGAGVFEPVSKPRTSIFLA